MLTRYVRSLRKLSTYLLTNNAFVFKPFNESPRHFNQNRSSSFFKLAGSLPAKEAPGIRAHAAIRDDQNIREKPRLTYLLASLPCY